MSKTDAASTPAQPDEADREIALEQAHVDRVYAELGKAGERISLVETEGLARGRASRSGDMRDEEKAGLFERDALMFSAGKRRATLEQQYEGLVFGRLDLDHTLSDGAGSVSTGTGDDLEVRYIGRLGVRDDEYEPLVIDWRAPAASAFYRATPVSPQKVVRRRVLRCRDSKVLGVEDDLMVAQAPEGMTVVGDGALMAALTRTRGATMRDIVATIQQHQDEAIRADARGVTEITGGPGTGKTVVALHRAAYLLYSDRRRFEAGGILVVGPSSAYTAYIERVLPSLGEDSVALRALGDIVDGVTATRLDSPEAAHVKGALSIRKVLSNAAKDVAPEAPSTLRVMVGGLAINLGENDLRRVRRQMLGHHQHNKLAGDTNDLVTALGEVAWLQVRSHTRMERTEFLDKFEDSRDVEQFVAAWWHPIDPREVLLWLTDAERLRRYAQGVLNERQQQVLRESIEVALETGEWSVADVALMDDLLARLAQVPEMEREERGFYEIEEFDNLSDYGVTEVEVTGSRRQDSSSMAQLTPTSARERLLAGRLTRASEYSHVLVDEAQDLSPMQWRAVGRRGKYASWTVVGDLAQASWPDLDQAHEAREEAFGSKQRQSFHMTTNYRNAREIFDFAAEFIRRYVPDADIPQAVRETGHHPVSLTVSADDVLTEARARVEELLDRVDGSVAVIAPAKWRDALSDVIELDPRVIVIDPMSTKGLEYDATLVVDPNEISAESPGGARVLYVVLTRAAHRMTVLEVQ